MKFYIRNIILYPRDRSLSPRVIPFEENKVNIITGYSQRGKSALISIIDYCLGSGECNIPVGPIREKVEVFALYVRFEDHYFFIGRENYDESKSTMYFYREEVRGENLLLRSNEWLKYKNEYRVNLEYVKKQLNFLAGFKNIGNDGENNFNRPASFRDTAAFQFQPQNIIANPTTMFYKTESWEHLQKLKTIFPLILGYSSYEILNLRAEIQELEVNRNKLSTKIEEVRTQYEGWQRDIYEYYMEAISLNLTNSDMDIKSSSVDQIKQELSTIVANIKEGNLFKKGSANRYNEKLQDLGQKRDILLRELNNLRIRLNKIELIDNSKEQYISDVASEKEKRLKPVEWFLQQDGTNICPFCNSESTKAIDELLSLSEERARNRKVLEHSKSLLFSFDKERNSLRKEINAVENSIDQIDSSLKVVSNEDKISQRTVQKTYEFAGKLDHAIENLNKISPSGLLTQELEELERQVWSKKKRLRELELKFDKALSLSKLSRLIGKYVILLPIEEKYNRKVYLDPDQSLNIKVEDTTTKNVYFLSRLGSGANYMGYHLSTLFGLHEFFHDLKETNKPNYVPSFLVLDQPSQVYYPEEFKPQEDGKGSKDIEDTRKIFETCAAFMSNTDNEIQLIILEHVPKSTWENLNDEVFHLVMDWRGEEGEEDYDALIPQDWF